VPAPQPKTPTVVKIAGHRLFKNCQDSPPLNQKSSIECMFEGRQKSRGEKETYSPGSSDLSAGCNSLWTAFPTSLAVPEI
jgi:hypothetical protein